MKLETKDPRAVGRQAVKETVDPILWEKNLKFTDKLESALAKHPISQHPLMEFFDNETINKDKSLRIHQEFGYAFAQIFTDAVLQAMTNATQLEKRLGPKGKVTARFLWAINLQDEIGFIPSGNEQSYAGHPLLAHYFQYVQLFKDLGATETAIQEYQPSVAAQRARATFIEYYNDYTLLTSVLALAESIFDKFAGSWADNVERSTDIDTSIGYHTIHVEDDHGESIDDEHSEDSWTLVRQCLTEDRYEEIENKAKEWLDEWYAFADSIMKMAME
ncbi:MAG: iron-containing redox enzyme family protein [Bdellovibrionales bacterium]|nr:iron-containing redox enzyme family protein [Bdellovibrionales bacterium]